MAEQEAAPARSGWWHDFYNTQVGYRTPQTLRTNNPYLAIVYWTLVILVLVHIGLVACRIDGLHQEHGAGIGTVIAKLSGKAFLGGRGYDPADLALGGQDDSTGVFIATRIVTQRGQVAGQCLDYGRTCPCPQGFACVAGFCKGTSWCPSLGDGNVRGAPKGAPPEAGADPTVERLDGLGKVQLSFEVGVSFPSLGGRLFAAGQSPGAKDPYRNFTLDELLSQASTPIKLDALRDYGGIVGVQFFWDCNVALPCEPLVLVQRLDGDIGYHLKRARRYYVDGSEKRDAVYAFGIKVQVSSSGIGRRTSLALIALQVGSGLALLRLATLAADFLLMHVLHSRYRKEKVAELEKVHKHSRLGPMLENEGGAILADEQTPLVYEHQIASDLLPLPQGGAMDLRMDEGRGCGGVGQAILHPHGPARRHGR